jgi:DnaJ-domain-containing protein 1
VAYLVLGAVALWLILRASGRPILKRREWRFLTGGAAIAAFAGAAYAAVREAWVIAAVLVLFGGWLALSTRRPPGAAAAPPAARPGRMSPDEARAILGVGPAATPDEIRAAYTRLMRAVHPDKGGSAGLAAQLNAARERLLRR